jgi:tetratricopeptide (TPR) repeat protein
MSVSTISTTAGPGWHPDPHADPGWLFGRRSDLILGCGLGYVSSVPVLAGFAFAAEETLAWPPWIAALIALLVNVPHYGATVLRAYEKPEDRRKYVYFTLHTTLALGLLLFAGLHWALLGSLLVTLYASWAPWHFAGQNYGIALMLLKRRGVEVTPGAKRLLHASFFLSFVLAFLEIHAVGGTRDVLGITNSDVPEYDLVRLGLPLTVVRPLTAALGLAYLGALVGAAAALLRHGSPRQIAPAALLAALQSLWFTVPALASTLGGSALVLTLPFSLVWISMAHSAQYLWVTAYYDRRSNPHQSSKRFLWRCLMSGSVLTVAPGLVVAPGLWGPVPWDGGLAVVLFAVVNLHHFLLDGAIWKLRDGRIAGVLLRSDPAPARLGSAAPAAAGWRRGAMVAAGLACLLITVHELWEIEIVYSHAGADAERARGALDRLRFTGRDSARLRLETGQVLLSQGRPAEAVTEFQRSLAMSPSADGFALLGLAFQRQGEWDVAAGAHAAALALDPNQMRALVQGALVDLHRADGAGAEEGAKLRADADRKLTRALELDPDHLVAGRRLAELRSRPAS